MKTIKPIIVLMLSLAFLTSFAQKEIPRGASDGTQVATRDNEFQCLPNSVFSQVHPYYDQAWFGEESYDYSRVADDYTASGPFNTMRFWGSNFWECPVGTTIDFIIRFYARNPGDPASPGAQVLSFTKTVTPVPMGIFAWSNSEIYQVDVDFSTTITQLDGWVSVSRTNSNDGCYFGWYCLTSVGNTAQYYTGEAWYPVGGDSFFCLGAAPVIPVSNWALYIGIGLILAFTVVRFRKMI